MRKLRRLFTAVTLVCAISTAAFAGDMHGDRTVTAPGDMHGDRSITVAGDMHDNRTVSAPGDMHGDRAVTTDIMLTLLRIIGLI